MKKIKIKGNDYVMAHERVMEFHKLYSNGSIVTEIIEMTDRFITVTKVTPDVDKPERYFTGIAYEDVTGSGVNSTSALENCETSSCARAMGFLNIGIDTSIASAEEVQNAIEQQQSPSAPKVDLKEQEVANPLFEEAKKKFDGKALDSDDWDGTEVIKFGKYRNNSGDPSNDITWAKLVDAAWMEWVAKSSKVDWQREKAQKELNRRGISG